MSMGMGFGFRHEHRQEHCQEQRFEQRQEHSVDYPKVVMDIKEHFKDNEAGDVRNLKELLRTIPQRQNGRLAYVIGGGWAVEVLTGKARDHGNINVLVVDPNRTTLESNRCLDYLGVQYLENALKKALIKKDIIRGDWKRGRQNVYVPSREFMIGTKLLPRTAQESNRDKDISDVVELLAVKPDAEKLAKVFNSLPYISNGDSLASVVYGVSGLRSHKETILRSLNSALREQLGAYEEKQRISRERSESGDILRINLLPSDFEALKRYFQKEAPAEDYHAWLVNNRSKLVNPSGRIYRPNHPVKEPCFVNMEGFKNAIIDEEDCKSLQKEANKFPGEVFSVCSFGDGESVSLSVWNPQGKLIYEFWKK